VRTLEPSNHGWCEELYRQKAGELLLYGRALGLSHGEAEDVLQETFIALLALKQQPANTAGYAVRALRNRALNYKRSLWRRLTRELESKSWFEPSEQGGPGLEAALRSLRELPSEQREVIVLKIWHRHTFEEIGEILEISPNTAAGRYRYGLQKLRASVALNDYESAGIFGDADGEVRPALPIA